MKVIVNKGLIRGGNQSWFPASENTSKSLQDKKKSVTVAEQLWWGV